MPKKSELNYRYEDEISLDSSDRPRLLWEKTSRKQDFALSEAEDKASKDKARERWKDKAALDGRKTKVCDEFWEDFVLLSKVCLLRNPDADLYDVFDTIRTKFLGGWGYTESYIAQVDADIERELARKAH
jgi:hypothetical protein